MACAAGLPACAASRGAVLPWLSDEALLVPIAMRHADPSLFAGDRWLDATAPIFSTWYSALLSAATRLAGEPTAALAALSLLRSVVHLAGIWRLAAAWTGGRAAEPAGFAAALASAVLPEVAVRTDWGPGAGTALPRDVVLAALPWAALLLLGDGTRAPALRRTGVVFAALGVAANVHPLTAAHVALLVGSGALVLHAEFRRPASMAVAAAGFAAGAAPYLVRFAGLERGEGVADRVVWTWHLQTMAGEIPTEVAAKMEAPLLAAVAAALGWRAASRGGAPASRTASSLVWFAVVIAAVGGILPHAAEWTSQLLLGRFHRIASILALAWVVAAAARLAAQDRRAAAALCASSLLVASASPFVTSRIAGGKARPLATIPARMLERRLGISSGRPWPADLPHRDGAADPSAPGERPAFLAVCAFAAKETSPGDSFLVPPETWAPFRAHAARGAAVTRKEGGAALSYLGARGMDWYRDYRDAVACYKDGDAAAWRALAAKHRATWAVTDRGTAAPPWPVAFESGPYRVLRVPEE
ncbi:MAG: hypothetical protein HMLKMBBP_01932 [Planctomycetes bacterium]|nr:hypothetical protein [Planctomycetota bacterium]